MLGDARTMGRAAKASRALLKLANKASRRHTVNTMMPLRTPSGRLRRRGCMRPDKKTKNTNEKTNKKQPSTPCARDGANGHAPPSHTRRHERTSECSGVHATLQDEDRKQDT